MGKKLYYGDPTNGVLINLTDASKITLSSSRIRVSHGPTFDDIEMTDKQRSAYLFTQIAKYLSEEESIMTIGEKPTEEQIKKAQENGVAPGQSTGVVAPGEETPEQPTVSPELQAEIEKTELKVVK